MTAEAKKPLKRGRGFGKVVALVLVVGVVAGLTGWSLAKIFSPPAATTSETVVNTYTVKQGSIGKSITLNAAAAWASEASGVNRAAGVVTSVESTEETKHSGDAIYAVDLEPVAIVAGSTPAFREITAGTEGPDVVQLAVMLAERGYSVDPDAAKVDWVFAQAIKAWQKDIGAKETGSVADGAVIFTPGLPARIQFDPEVFGVGTTLLGSEKVLTVASAVPEFTIEVPNEQAQSVPVGTPVAIKNGDAKWPGQVSGIRDLANVGNKLLVPRVEGLVVPSSAIRTSAAGATTVRVDSGAEQPVDVIGTSAGMSIVTGVDAGTVIQLWAPEAPKP